MKIAVGALRLAERRLDVNPESHRDCRNSSITNYDGGNGRKFLGRIRNRLNKDLAFPRPVEFAQEYSLPGAEHQPAVFDEYCLACPREDRFGVRVGVPFSVAIRAMMRNEAVQHAFEIM